MNPLFAQAIPPMWILPFGLIYLIGIPAGAVISIGLTIFGNRILKSYFHVLSVFTIIVPLFGFVSMTIIGSSSRAFYNKTAFESIRENWEYSGMTVLAFSLGAVSIARRVWCNTNTAEQTAPSNGDKPSN